MAENQTKNREIGAGEPLIQVKELCKSFDGVDVLKNITTTIKRERSYLWWGRPAPENPRSSGA